MREKVGQSNRPLLCVLADQSRDGSRYGLLGEVLACGLFRSESESECLRRLQATDSGVLLIDVDMPRAQRLLEALRPKPTSLPVIVVCDRPSFEDVGKVFRLGATDILTGEMDTGAFVDRLEIALRDDEDRARRRANLLRYQEMLDSLTPRERQVMGCVVDGHRNYQTALELGISERTVEVHRQRVMRKMDADSLAELVQMMVAIEGARGAAPSYVS